MNGEKLRAGKRVGEVELKVADLPQELKTSIAQHFKLNGQKAAGRPNLLQILKERGHDPYKLVLELAYMHYVEQRSLDDCASFVAKKYGIETTKMTISNMFDKLTEASLLNQIVDFASAKVARKVKIWFIDDDGQFRSDIDYIQSWIERHKNTLKRRVMQRHLIFLEEVVNFTKKLPHEWSEEDIAKFLNAKYEHYKATVHERAAQNAKGFYAKLSEKELDDRARENTRRYLSTIRRFLLWVGRSDLAVKFGHSEWKREYTIIDYMTVEEFDKVMQSDMFTDEEKLLLKLHVTLGCREGHHERSGLSGLRWSKIDWKRGSIDVYESKTKGGTIWRGCYLGLFWPDLPEALRKAYETMRKNDSDFIVDSLLGIESIYQVQNWYASMAKRLTRILGRHYRMHFNRKTHAIWLIESDVALEVIAGKPESAFFGVGWEDVQVLLQHYGTFTAQKLQRELDKVRARFA